eukprot:ANDGO_03867.mRNA.1 hypothetical protein
MSTSTSTGPQVSSKKPPFAYRGQDTFGSFADAADAAHDDGGGSSGGSGVAHEDPSSVVDGNSADMWKTRFMMLADAYKRLASLQSEMKLQLDEAVDEIQRLQGTIIVEREVSNQLILGPMKQAPKIVDDPAMREILARVERRDAERMSDAGLRVKEVVIPQRQPNGAFISVDEVLSMFQVETEMYENKISLLEAHVAKLEAENDVLARTKKT